MSEKYELNVTAIDAELQHVSEFISGHLEAAGCSMKAAMQLDVAVEEIFVNIAHYAYVPDTGYAHISIEIEDSDPKVAVIEFRDGGKPFDPLAKPDPDITLSAEERGIGGLGIYMVKKSMDEVTYRYENSQNILTIKKSLN